MNALLNIGGGQPLTMSSREISDLTGSTHDNVLKTIRRLAADGVVSGNETPYRHPQNGQTYQEFLLSFRDTMVVVSGYSAELRAKIIDRWQELEAGVTPALNLRQPGQMLAVAMQLAEICQEQQSQLTAQAPKVAFHDAVADASNTQTVAEVAKVLGIGSRRLFAFLRDEGILMVNNLPFQHHLDAGRFRVVEKTWSDENGTSRTYCQTRITGKGLAFIQQRLAKVSETQGV